ncbi:MAG: phosphopantothenate--cysteine ligase [Peptococcaceae bacterium]|jgi:phosphopantothenate-cysteine ligase|nr:phosphopantothenate--cysteine ligase [Peptococcaceae bacterium]
MQILITAGGTREPIDGVRTITNTSTGRLGALIAEAFAARDSVTEIHYLCGPSAAVPRSGKARIIPAADVAGLEAAVRNILGHHRIDAVVHCMAVSDYRVRRVTSAAMMADAFVNRPEETSQPAGRAEAESLMVSLLDEAAPVAAGGGKISSQIDRMVLVMERTPKIISLFRELSPRSVLVGFKLLDHAGHEDLMDAAHELMKKAQCDFVLANDLRDITGQSHVGYLVGAGKSVRRLNTKEEIAEAIAEAVLEQRNGGGSQ